MSDLSCTQPTPFDPNARIDFGPCCACGREGPDVGNLMLLDKKAPEAGTGWACSICGLGPDGAVAVVCDECINQVTGIFKAQLRFAIIGRPVEKRRIRIDELAGQHRHDLAKHQGDLLDMLGAPIADEPFEMADLYLEEEDAGE